MPLSCLIGHHRPLPPAAHNQGFQFSRCSCCGRDMLRSGRSWRRVPRGFRVVWRRRSRPDSSFASAQAAARPDVPAVRRRRTDGLRTVTGLIDLVRAAMRVLLWAWHDRIHGLRLWMRALPARPKPPLRLPSA